MKFTTWIVGLSAAVLLAGCGGGGGGVQPASLQTSPRFFALLNVTGAGATTNFAFDISMVDNNRFYFTDRTNASVDVFDTVSGAQLAQIKGTGANAFAGSKPSNANSGPDGINAVGGLIYAGDVNSVKVIDPTSNTIVNTITTGNQGVRSDEACVDDAHSLYFIAAPEASTPYVSVINTQTQMVIATITFTDPSGNASAGLEACQWDATTDTYFINNDGTTANPHGELISIPGASIRGIAAGATVNYTALAGSMGYGEGNCDPTGLALGPGSDIAVGCREGTAGAPLLVEIFNRTNGTMLASLNAGGGDQLVFSAIQNRYYNSASRWTASGLSSGAACTAASPCTPRLITIDAASRSVLAMVPSGNNAHSVAIDPVTGRVFMPTSSNSAPAGCADCDLSSAGVIIFQSVY